MLRRSTATASAILVGILAFAGCSSPTTGTTPAEENTTNSTTEEEAVETEAPAAAEGTRENPFPIGTLIESDEWTITINSVTLAANDVVAAANQFNEAADPGTEFIVVNYTATYTGADEDGQMAAFTTVDYVTGSGTTVNSLDKLVVAPEPAIDTMSPLYNGGSVTGNVAIQVPTPVDGVLAVTPGMMADKVFVAVQ